MKKNHSIVELSVQGGTVRLRSIKLKQLKLELKLQSFNDSLKMKKSIQLSNFLFKVEQ